MGDVQISGTTKFWALVPAFNEKERIALTVNGLAGLSENINIVVVDDGSQDATAREADRAGAQVISTGKNIGKGGALNLALDSLSLDDDDLILFIDADLGATSSAAAVLVDQVDRGLTDMAIAAFGARKKSGFGFAVGLARWGLKRFTGQTFVAPLSGQRAFRAGLLRAIGGLESGFGMEVGLTIDASRLGFKVSEVTVDMSHNETGRDLAGFKHRGHQFVAVAKVLTKKAFLRRQRPKGAEQ